ncbi:histone-lysine N-methyltransferase SETMAR-like [Octopus sinensis]|uniref:Histone-lysine N-methyltransferase SETMAR-like n=1 Tax=Octopus sinensis TaxID=2607531 RepID=A0A6P7SMP7_9MOLL|nr:histone-lysine N-methyltransferase SETMAR-like [Octopus sinensis]
MNKFVLHQLKEIQRNRHLTVCSRLISWLEREPFLYRLITCDEKWILFDNSRRTGQWSDAGESPEHNPKPPLHLKDLMVALWWSTKDVIHYSFLQQGKTVTATSYCQETDCMHEKLKKKRPRLVNRDGPILLHDNAQLHTSQATVHKLQSLNYEILVHPLYSSDITPTGYHIFKHFELAKCNKTFLNT